MCIVAGSKRAADPQLFIAVLDPAAFLNADPDPAAFLMQIRLQLKNLGKKLPYEDFEEFSVYKKEKKDNSKVKK